VEETARPAAAQWPAMAYLEQMLFVNPRERQKGKGEGEGEKTDEPIPTSSNPQSPIPNPSNLNIEILAAARQVGEIEWIGTRINDCWSMARPAGRDRRGVPLAARG